MLCKEYGLQLTRNISSRMQVITWKQRDITDLTSHDGLNILLLYTDL